MDVEVSFTLPLVVVIGSPPRATMAANEIADVVSGHADVASARDPEAMAALTREDGRQVAVVVIVADDLDVDETLDQLLLLGAIDIDDVRIVVVSWHAEHRDMARTVDSGRLNALVAHPTEGIVGWMVASEVRGWLVDHAHAALTLPAEPNAPGGQSDLLGLLHATEEELVARLMDVVESALGPRAVMHLPSGTRLTRQGLGIEGVYVVLEGKVALTRTIGVEQLLLHHASTGPVVGLLALTSRRKAHFTSTATTDLVVVHLSIEQLDRALRLAPRLGVVLAALSMQTLTQRLLRSEELQFERNQLNRELDAERVRLATALKDLQEARLELVSQARFAMLGELSAGVAHELNNPVAAISGAVSHLRSDVEKITAGHPDEALLDRVMRIAAEREAVSTAVERKARREIEARTGDHQLAFRMVGSGILDPDLAAGIAPESLDRVEAAAALGTATRNITVATARISELVHSLRAYSRPEGEMLHDVDVQMTIEDTLHLLSHRLRGITVEREYTELPHIAARPSQLGQVWTNIIVNAVDALDGDGQITITTSVTEDHSIQVEIADDGCGIEPEALPHIFEPRFSTKLGTVRYGLGLGLGISRRIVEEHGGTLTARSGPGGTTMSAIIPIAGPSKESA